ncbi:MAG TPA: hypothetical protein VK762_29155 [Polyangiaceae bacterium]|nr:hypothetical protein [Polyangiaceae bacterium]
MKKWIVVGIVGMVVGSVSLLGCGGQDGKNGTDGTNGAPGASGETGEPSLVVTVDEPSGTNCPNGGEKIETGVDKNGNGVLDPSEITSTSYVCDGVNGDAGPPGASGDAGPAGASGDAGAPGEGTSSLIRTSHELAGANCVYGGVRIESGLDANRDGVLQDSEVNAAATQFICQTAPAYRQLDALPAVTAVHGFALTASADDGSPRLGYMFTDAAYQQSLVDGGAITNIGGSYSGPNTYVTYQLSGSAWQAYEGRETPQTYAYSELAVVDGASYYTTNYPSFGGLVSAIRNGGKGTYALTPAFTTRKAHSIAVPPGSDTLYALIAQNGTTGLTFSSFPVADFGSLSNFWTNLATLDSAASTVSYPQLLVAGTDIVATYVQGTSAVIRATSSPATVAAATDVPVIGGCDSAVLADSAWDGTDLYVACVDSLYNLTVKSASLSDLTAVAFTTIATSVTGEIDAIDLEASARGVSLALRQGTAVRVYAKVTDPLPAFDAVLPGSFDLTSAAPGLVLAVCDSAGDHTLRTYVSF